MTELLVGTRKGLFVLEGEPGAAFEPTARAFAGEPVEYAIRDPRTGRYLASVTSGWYGPKVWITDDPAGEWQETEGVALPEGGEQALKRIWTIVPGEEEELLYAGGDPAVLFDRQLPQRVGVVNWNGVLNSPPVASAQFSMKKYGFRNSGGTGPLPGRLWPGFATTPDDIFVEKSAPSAFFPGCCPLPDVLQVGQVLHLVDAVLALHAVGFRHGGRGRGRWPA